MSLAKRIRSWAVSKRGNNKEQYFYLTLQYGLVSVGFSHTDLGCGSRKARATLLVYSEP